MPDFTTSVLQPYRTASKPYQYLAIIGIGIFVLEITLVATQQPIGPGSWPRTTILGIMMAWIGIFAYLSWRQGELSKEVVKSNRTMRSLCIILLWVPLLLDTIIGFWSDFM